MSRRTADNSHAERQIAKREAEHADNLRRAMDLYDALCSSRFGMPEYRAREHAIDGLRMWAGLTFDAAAILLADALARRAANKLKGE